MIWHPEECPGRDACRVCYALPGELRLSARSGTPPTERFGLRLLTREERAGGETEGGFRRNCKRAEIRGHTTECNGVKVEEPEAEGARVTMLQD